MEQHPEDKRLDELIEHLFAAYELLGRLLGKLPIRIGLPEIEDEDWTPASAIQAVDRAREIVLDQPLETQVSWMIGTVLLDWTTVHELGFLAGAAGPAPWRLDAMEYGLQRITTVADEVATQLGIDIWFEE